MKAKDGTLRKPMTLPTNTVASAMITIYIYHATIYYHPEKSIMRQDPTDECEFGKR